MAKTLLEFGDTLNYNKQLSKYANNLTLTYERCNIEKLDKTIDQLTKKLIMMASVVTHTKEINNSEFIDDVSHRINSIVENLETHLKSRVFTENIFKNTNSEPMIDLSPVQSEKPAYYNSIVLPLVEINPNQTIDDEEEVEEDLNRPLILPARPKTENN